MIKKIGNIKLWSFLVFGFLFLIFGVYLLVSGKGSPGMIKAMVVAGTGQLVIFYVLFFLLYRERLKKKSDK